MWRSGVRVSCRCKLGVVVQAKPRKLEPPKIGAMLRQQPNNPQNDVVVA